MSTPLSIPVSGSGNQVESPDHKDLHVAPGEIAVGVVIGRASEYFDFFVYGIASAIVFPSIFFPGDSRLLGTLYAFMIFSLAFIARPIGTVLFMALQERYGREMKLTVALFLLGAATCGMAFVPAYNQLGTASIVVLSALRILQGIALGGSWDGLPSLVAMSAPENKRGWYAMLGQLGGPLGFAIAAALFSYLLTSLPWIDFLSWGWRYPFYVAFAINVVALFARLRIVSSEDYAKLLDSRELAPAKIHELVVDHQGRNILIGALAPLASYALFHLVTVFPLSWVLLFGQRSVAEILVVQIVGSALAAGGIVASGAIADRYGRRNTLGTLAVLIGIFSVGSPWLLEGSAQQQNIFILVGFILLGLSYGQSAGAVTSNFIPRFRYTGAALTSDLAWLLGAAFAPLVALYLSSHFGLAYVGVYLLSGAVSTLVALSVNRAFNNKE